MKPYCLSEEELKQFIEVIIRGRKIFEDENDFYQLTESWRSWEIELICLVTLFSRFLEQEIKSGEDGNVLLQQICDLLDTTGLWLNLEGFGPKFITYIFRFIRDESLSIDDDLNYLRQKFGEYDY